jgi:hypothetical protein
LTETTREETLEAFLAACGAPTVENLGTQFRHPFLFREVLFGEESPRLTKEELSEREKRNDRLMGRGTLGATSARSLLKDGVTGGPADLEARIVRVNSPDGSWPVALGSGATAAVTIEGGDVPEVACYVESSPDGAEFTIVVESDGLWYGGERRAPGARVRLEEGLALQLGGDAIFQTFTSTGFAHFLAFRSAIKAAQARGGV